MKTTGLAVTFVLLTLSFIEATGHAQTRRSRSRAKPPDSESSRVMVRDAAAHEELARIFGECVTPGRPMPDFAFEMSMLCGNAISLPRPLYPPEAKAEKASGTVVVKTVTDEAGRVIWAEAVQGHPLLRPTAVNAACVARFSPTKRSGREVRVLRRLSYNFQL